MKAGVRTISVSEAPEEKFIAFGTELGHVDIYEVDNLVSRFEYWKYKFHDGPIWSIQFIMKGLNYLALTGSEDGNLSLVCLKECILLHKFNFNKEKIYQCQIIK